MPPPNSYLIAGTLYNVDSTIGKEGMTISAVNLRTGERITTTSQANGQYIVDAGNFQNGYNNKDVVYLSAGDSDLEGQEAVDWIARQIIKQTKDAWRDDLVGTLYYPVFVQNAPVPYDEDNKLFRRTLTLRFNAENIGE